MSRCRCSATRTAMPCICSSATARSSAATRRSSSARRRPISSEALRQELCGYALKIAKRDRLCRRRHGRVPDGCRHRQVLLHRGQSAHPGRAHGHRAGDRHRHRQGADPHPRRLCHRHAGIGRAGAGGHPAQRPRAAVPHHHRRSRSRTSSRTMAASPPIAAPPASASGSTAAPPIRARSSPASTIRCWRRSPPGRRRRRRRSRA